MIRLRSVVSCAALALLTLAVANCSSTSKADGGGGGTGGGGGSSTGGGTGGGTSDAGGGTSDAGGGTGTDGGSCPMLPPPPTDAAPLLAAACDPLVPSFCGYPFPSNVYLVDDATTATGKRVAIPQDAMPLSRNAGRLPPTMVSDSDGFSPGQTILAHLPAATITGLPTQDTIASSITTNSPTILLNADTGEFVPHFTELDMELPEDAGVRALLIRPIVRLADATRYIVAIRHVVDENGTAIEPSPVFQALRDGTASCDPSVALRKTLYDDIFAKLQTAGIARADLQLAWDYSTASRENNTRWMLHMRDDALATVGTAGPSYTLFPPAAAGTCTTNGDCGDGGSVKCIHGACLDPTMSPCCNHLTQGQPSTETQALSPSEIGSGNCSQDGPNPHIWRRLFGLMTVPLYTTSPNPTLDSAMMVPAGLNFGDGGLPVQNGTAQFEFEVNIPVSATVTPGHPIVNGHGLLGDKTEGDSSYLALIDDSGDYVSISVDLVGFCQDDYQGLVNTLAFNPAAFKDIVGRQHQGMINQLLAMRLMNTLAADPATFHNGNPTIDPSKHFYRGDSQGGIMGTTYMALSTDVTLGVLGEPGAPYSLLLNRSADFSSFFSLLHGVFGDGRTIQLFMGLMQMVWDRTEPDGYMPYVVSNNLPNTPSHAVLIHDNIGDYQVTPLGAHLIARAVGAKNLSVVNREIYGIADATGPISGSAIVEWSWGLNPAPETNTPPGDLCPANAPPMCGDPHDQTRIQPSSVAQEVQWFSTGTAVQTCDGGPCVGTFY